MRETHRSDCSRDTLTSSIACDTHSPDELRLMDTNRSDWRCDAEMGPMDHTGSSGAHTSAMRSDRYGSTLTPRGSTDAGTTPPTRAASRSPGVGEGGVGLDGGEGGWGRG